MPSCKISRPRHYSLDNKACSISCFSFSRTIFWLCYWESSCQATAWVQMKSPFSASRNLSCSLSPLKWKTFCLVSLEIARHGSMIFWLIQILDAILLSSSSTCSNIFGPKSWIYDSYLLHLDGCTIGTSYGYVLLLFIVDTCWFLFLPILNGWPSTMI